MVNRFVWMDDDFVGWSLGFEAAGVGAVVAAVHLSVTAGNKKKKGKAERHLKVGTIW